jgi:hypothetical protein
VKPRANIPSHFRVRGRFWILVRGAAFRLLETRQGNAFIALFS